MATRKAKKRVNLFDAVAGRVASTGFIPDTPRISKNRYTPSSSTVAVAPEEVLFRRKNAPQRYEETDFYWANTELRPDQRLPDSDLLKAIHTYTADFYARATENGGKNDVQSMNETALLAFGILLEESAAHVFGENGDMAFVEGEPIDDQSPKTSLTAGPEGESQSHEEGTTTHEQVENRGRKRRRIK